LSYARPPHVSLVERIGAWLGQYKWFLVAAAASAFLAAVACAGPPVDRLAAVAAVGLVFACAALATWWGL
jgi:hypothetical protein